MKGPNMKNKTANLKKMQNIKDIFSLNIPHFLDRWRLVCRPTMTWTDNASSLTIFPISKSTPNALH